MPEVVFAEPTIRTQRTFDILPAPAPQAPAPQAPALAPIPIYRPIDNHAKPQNLPPIQQKIQETSQPYKPTPQYDGKPSGGSIGSANALRTSGQIQRDNPGLIQQQANVRATEAVGMFGLGIYDQITGANRLQENNNPRREQITLGYTGPENAIAYEVGRRVADEIPKLIRDVDKTREDLWKKRPQFEMPKPQLPDLPKLPNFKLPDLPEFKIPKFKFPELPDWKKPILEPKISIPKIKPMPKNLTRQLREIELSACGDISFGIAYAIKFTEEYRENGDEFGNQYAVIREQITLEEYFAIHAVANEEPFTNLVSFLESSGGTGGITPIDLGGGVTYRYYGLVETRAFRTTNYPTYYGFGGIVEVTGIKSKTALNQVLDSLSSETVKPEIYKINVSNRDAKDCPIGKTPPLEEPPPPPDRDCDCMAQCCPDIDYRKIRAIVEEELKKLDLVAAIPISWQIRNEGNRPQLVIQSAEEDGVDNNGNRKYKSAMYPISVPHWDGNPGQKISLPPYIKGNYEGIFTLRDNSKVTINAKNEIECKRILNAIKPYISKEYLEDAYFKGGLIVRKNPIKESRVQPRYGRYFKEGQKNNKPDWRIDFV
jgi:hypothetical protein